MSAQQQGGVEALSPLAEKVVEGLVAAGAGTAGLLNPDLGIAATGAAPLVSEALTRAVAVVVRRRRRNVAEMLAEAERRADLEEEELLERLVSTPARQELLATAVEAAARATLEEKIKALGHALANGAIGSRNGDGVVDGDGELFVVQAIADLERPHLWILRLLSVPGPQHPHEQWSLPEMAHEVGLGAAVAHSLMATLLRHGLIEQHQNRLTNQRSQERIPIADVTWSITGFGVQVLHRLRTAGSQ